LVAGRKGAFTHVVGMHIEPMSDFTF